MGEGRDEFYEAFLRRTFEEVSDLARQSDLFRIEALEGSPPERFVAEFACRGLVRTADGRVRETDRFGVGIWFPSDYLRRAEVPEVLTFLGPLQVFHPNVLPPWICLGHIIPGTPLVDLAYRCFEILSFQRVTMREDKALNPMACRWARENRHRFPVDRRPLKWRKPAGPIEAMADGEAR